MYQPTVLSSWSASIRSWIVRRRANLLVVRHKLSRSGHERDPEEVERAHVEIEDGNGE